MDGLCQVEGAIHLGVLRVYPTKVNFNNEFGSIKRVHGRVPSNRNLGLICNLNMILVITVAVSLVFGPRTRDFYINSLFTTTFRLRSRLRGVINSEGLFTIILYHNVFCNFETIRDLVSEANSRVRKITVQHHLYLGNYFGVNPSTSIRVVLGLESQICCVVNLLRRVLATIAITFHCLIAS